MASRTSSVSTPETSAKWKWLRENRPDKVARIYFLGSREREEKKICDVVFGDRGFILTIGVHENEEKPCAVTETTWTVTYVTSDKSALWTGSTLVGLTEKHAAEIFRGGGLEVYTFYCDD